MPLDLGPLNQVWTDIGAIGLATYLADAPEVRDSANPKYLQIARRGAAKTGTDLYRILDLVFTLRNQSHQLFTEFDAVLMPTAAAKPFPKTIDGQSVGPRGHAVFTGWVNAAGLPAVAFPVRFESMSIGMQLIGKMGSEQTLLACVDACAEAFVWPDIATRQA
jgi:aspartyl-tRNA(Asn)/glutamyl-tRNA(Gln) amidotransferase subunit A